MILPKLISCVIALGMASGLAFAQSKKILGYVKNSETSRPIQGAQISASGADARDKALTDDAGCFTLFLSESVGPVVRLRVEARGFKVADQQVAVTDEKVYSIVLTPQPTAPAMPKNHAGIVDTYVAPKSFIDALRADAKIAFESVKQRYHIGIDNFFSVIIAHDEVIRVELLVAETKSERIAAYEAALDIATKLEAEAQSRYSAGVDSKNSVYLGRLHRSEVELMLAKEKSGGPR